MTQLHIKFINWYHKQFSVSDELFIAMANVKEGSRWHRESSIGVHTNMVINEYLAVAGTFGGWEHNDILGGFACAFHDVGKPEVKTSEIDEDGKKYFRFKGHELRSATLWVDWACRNWEFLKKEFNFTVEDIHKVQWIIEHHRPWSIKNTNTFKKLALGVMGSINNIDTYINALKSDHFGRTTDPEYITDRAGHWCDTFKAVFNNTKYPDNAITGPVLFMPIGCSASGKSTLLTSDFTQKIMDDYMVDNLSHFSLDVLRHTWYDKENYKNAYDKSCEDKNFLNKAHAEFSKLTMSGNSIFSDNINIRKKRRMAYINMAKQKGYTTVGIVMPIAIQVAIDRQESRADKTVPVIAVEEQYFNTQAPGLDEFDKILFYNGNLEYS